MEQVLLILVLHIAPATQAHEKGGCLQIERKNAAGKVEREVVKYVPREGDLVFYDEDRKSTRLNSSHT